MKRILLSIWFFAWLHRLLASESAASTTSTNYIAEVISIRYVRASQIANALEARSQKLNQSSPAAGSLAVSVRPRILVDERSNSLLIYASRNDMTAFRDEISRLDVPRKQLLLEAVIFEVSPQRSATRATKSAESLQQATRDNQPVSIGRIISDATTAFAGEHASNSSHLARLDQDLDVILTAFGNDTRVRVLQRPRIQTSDGVPATFFLGERPRYPTASYGCGSAYTWIQQLQTGVTLELTPRIKPDGSLSIDVHQTSEHPSGTVTIANVGKVPITNRVETRSETVVSDRATIVIGGWTQTAKIRQDTGTPILKQLPAVGGLFSSSVTRQETNQVFVLLRPTIIPDPERTVATVQRPDSEKHEPKP